MKGRKKQRASSCFQDEGNAKRERPSRGSTTGPGGGGGTHKTEKHVISPRRGEKARPREISRRLVLLLTPLPTFFGCRRPFLNPAASFTLPPVLRKAGEQHGAFYLFE